MVLVKEQGIDQWNKIENPETGSHKYIQLIFYKRAKAKQRSKDGLFNKCCFNNWTYTHTHTQKEFRHRSYIPDKNKVAINLNNLTFYLNI